MTASSSTIQAAAAVTTEASIFSGDLPLRLIVPFLLGAVFTLIITAVNHRRDHIKHVRDILSSAIQNVSHQGASFWAKKYDDETMVKLRGSVVFMQHILPYAVGTTHVNKKAAAEMEQLFSDISHVALFSKYDLNAENHTVNIERVAELSVYCARAEALSNTMLLDCMSLRAIISSNIVVAYRTAKKFCEKIHYILLVP